MITASQMLEEAVGTLHAWIDGYTEPDPEGKEPRRRIVVIGLTDSAIDVRVEGARFTNEPDLLFRITLEVAPLEMNEPK